MSRKNILIIQNMLKKSHRYDLALRMEGASYEVCRMENGTGEINIAVHPNHYMELLSLNISDQNLLKTLFNGVEHYIEIVSVTFSINTDVVAEDVSDTVYIFVDEAGDMDFSPKGSKYYMFNFLVKRRPFHLHEYIASYRYSLLERNLDPMKGNRLDIEAFHAHNDNKYIKEELFNIISTFDEKSVSIYAYILEKPKVEPGKRKEKERFYIDNLSFSIQRLLDRLGINSNFIIITDRLPVQKNKSKQIGALKKGIKGYLKSNGLQVRYDIFHHCSASSTNLQIVDYVSWAIYRKYEHGKDSYYEKIKHYILDEEVMTKNRSINHYER